MQPTVVEVQSLSKTFQSTWATGTKYALSNVTLSIEPGTVLGLVGANGSGKSTLMKCMLGLLRASHSPAKIIGAERTPRWGDPDLDRCSTSHIERLNLTLRMTSRRHTRLTNAHSKSLKHHVAFQAIFFAFYNFCRKHEALKGKTPAMASSAWTLKMLLEAAC